MNQTRIGSFIEVCINIAIGFAINWVANLYILPLYGFHISRRYSTGIAAYHCAECGAWHFGHHYSHKTPLPVIRRDHHIHDGPQRAGSF